MRISDWSSDVCSSDLGEIECRNGRLPDVGVDMAGKRSEPCLERIHAFDRAGEVAALDDLFDQPELLRRQRRVAVPDRDSRSDISNAGMICAKDRKSTRLNSRH